MGIKNMTVLFIGLLTLLLINHAEALRCYACVGKGCGGRQELCGSLLRNPVCAIIESSIYVKGCMSESVCKEQQNLNNVKATCCSTDFCNRY